MHYKCEWQNAETKCEISKKSALCCAAINFIFVVQIVGILRFDVGRLAIGGVVICQNFFAGKPTIILVNER
jgi:hypothetical protein